MNDRLPDADDDRPAESPPDSAGIAAGGTPSLGGGSAVAYHPLALDPDGHGFWGRVDRATERVTALLNPILPKEARQSLKSKQFLVTFFCLLAASCTWTILGIVYNAPEVYFLPTGSTMMTGYFLILSVSMFAFVPLLAFRSLAAELDEGTYEMLAITRLSAWRIVSGKLNSALLQMLIYFSAIVPCLAFCYLLKGIGLATIVLVIAIAFVTATVLTSLALLMSTLARGRTLQAFLLVALVAFIGIVIVTCCSIVFSVVLPEQWAGTGWGFFACFLVAGSFVILFLAAAAARIGPVTENRSTRLRGILMGQQVLWIATMTAFAWATEEFFFINFGMLLLGIFWFVVGTLMCGESPELSPRVRRGLPGTFFTRMLFTWWMPGPGTGFMFATSTGVAGLVVLALSGTVGIQTGAGRIIGSIEPLVFASVMIGYLLGYLGVVRLLSMGFLRRFGPSFVPPLVAATVAIIGGILLPSIIDVVQFGKIRSQYSVAHITNWLWTFEQSLDRSRLAAETAILILAVGGLIYAVNLISLFRAFRFRRIAVPRRVIEEGSHARRGPPTQGPAA